MISLNNFLSSLNSGIKAGHPFFKCSHTKCTVRLIAVLVKKNYLLGYRRCREDSTKLIVFFKVAFDRPKPLMLLCRKMSKQPCYIRVKSMKNLQTGSSL
jgi:ribosomal protein S8